MNLLMVALLLCGQCCTHVGVSVMYHQYSQLILHLSYDCDTQNQSSHAVANTFISLTSMRVLPGPVANTKTAPLFVWLMCQRMDIFDLLTSFGLRCGMACLSEPCFSLASTLCEVIRL